MKTDNLKIKNNLVKYSFIEASLIKDNLIKDNFIKANLVKDNLIKDSIRRNNFTKNSLIMSINNLTKIFNKGTQFEIKAIDNLNLKINKGDFIVIIGNNGAGKTTLLNIISGDLFPDNGNISIYFDKADSKMKVNCYKNIIKKLDKTLSGKLDKKFGKKLSEKLDKKLDKIQNKKFNKEKNYKNIFKMENDNKEDNDKRNDYNNGNDNSNYIENKNDIENDNYNHNYNDNYNYNANANANDNDNVIKKRFIDITYLEPYKRSYFIGRVFQKPDNNVAMDLTVEENLVLLMEKGYRSLKYSLRKDKLDFVYKSVEESGVEIKKFMKSKVKNLSGGQKQIVALLMALLTKPEIILLDEYTSALDPKNAKIVLNLTEKLVKMYGITAIMVTHNIKDAINIGNRLIMMKSGRIVFDIYKGKNNKNINNINDILKYY